MPAPEGDVVTVRRCIPSSMNRLVHDTRWRFYPEETYRSGAEEQSRPFVIRRGVVLDAE
jgi:hypothetical protein